MLTLTSPVETALHRVPAAPKLAGLCLFTALLFRFDGLVPLGVAVAGVAALHLALGRAFALHALAMLRPLWPFVLVVALWHVWLQAPETGAAILLRLGAAVGAANLVTMTTPLSGMIGVLERLAAPLRRLGLSPRTLALSLALVIRFVPVLTIRMAQITEAFRARSQRRPGYRVVVPAALAALDDAEHVAEALRARGGAG